MKGTLNKHEEGWLVRYGDMEFLPLHPDFIEMMDTCFTSKFTQVVDFEMVLCSHSKSKDDYYAKLIHHSVEPNEMVEDDDLTDDEWLIKELKKELSTCIVCDEEKQTHVVCMDCIVKTNHEISDEEIEKAKWEHFSDEYADMWSERIAFKLGAVWYREQLRLKTDKL